MSDTNPRQQIVEKIRNSNNILVTVNRNPSVDELSAALGLTLLINKHDKHATAIFSGDIPPAITFLDPEKTFENTVDSLRDFIIALDKEKADHLRYKVEGDVVKIFITPYRTTLSEQDLDFSQGDYNVEFVIAIGSKARSDLDQALESHGKILEEATVANLSVGSAESEVGGIGWHERSASSFSEMVAMLAESLKDKDSIDEQIATALLTGIVAATDRFSNNKTSAKVMTIAASLMASGANQQLIASKLEEAREIRSEAAIPKEMPVVGQNEPVSLSEGEPSKITKSEKSPKNDGSLSINHENAGKTTEEELERQRIEVDRKRQRDAAEQAQKELASHGANQLREENRPVMPDLPQSPPSEALPKPEQASISLPEKEPELGGTLNATAEQAADDKRRELDDDRNRTLLSHDHTNSFHALKSDQTRPRETSAFSAATQPVADEPGVADIFDYQETPVSKRSKSQQKVKESSTIPPETDVAKVTLEDIDRKNRDSLPVSDHDEARAAVEAALKAVPEPTPIPTPAVSPSLPPLPDFSTLPPLPPPPSAPVVGPLVAPTNKLEDLLPPVPPAPDVPPIPHDPAQFKIPGQN